MYCNYLPTFLAAVLCPTVALAVTLGDTTVTVEVRGGGSYTCVALHENEHESVQLAETMCDRAVILRHGGHRNVRFRLNGVEYTVDPNRIFTDTGRRKAIRPFSVAAEAAVEKLAGAVIKELTGTVVALHNNTEGRFSVRSYLPGGAEAAAAQHVSVVSAQDPDDFLLVVDPKRFVALVPLGYNLVLQADTPPDDGSLSVYCAQHCRSYINIETEHGRLRKQLEMLTAVTR